MYDNLARWDFIFVLLVSNLIFCDSNVDISPLLRPCQQQITCMATCVCFSSKLPGFCLQMMSYVCNHELENYDANWSQQ